MAMALGSFASRVVATRVVALDGTGDFTDIQSAITDLPAGGGVVYVREGTYTITSSLTFPNSNIGLFGAGKSTKIVGSFDDFLIEITSVAGIVIQDLWVYGSGAGATQHGIVINAGSKCRLLGCFISNCGASGIAVASASNIIISQCEIYGNGTYGIYMIGQHAALGYTPGPVNSCIVSNNYIHDNLSYGIFITNSGTEVADDNIIECNRIENNVTYSIRLENAYINRTIVLGNNTVGDTGSTISDVGTSTELGHNVES